MEKLVFLSDVLLIGVSTLAQPISSTDKGFQHSDPIF